MLKKGRMKYWGLGRLLKTKNWLIIFSKKSIIIKHFFCIFCIFTNVTNPCVQFNSPLAFMA